jgi:6,7-dimethyl-8-ribityllumazine synthase
MVASKNKSELSKESAAGKKFGIVVSQYHSELTEKLLEGAVKTLEGLGAKKDQIFTAWVPGSFEIPLAARAFAQQEMDAIICLGIVIKGETTHNEYIAREVARGVSQLSLSSGNPVIFGVLTTQTLEQAQARCGGDKGHKGIEAAEAAVSMIQVLEQIEKGAEKQSKSVGFGQF